MKTINVGNVTIKDGLSELLEHLKSKPDDLAPIVSKHALNIQANAAKDAPVDTGALKNSIIAEEKDKNHWEIHDGVEYGVFQELGTSRGVSAKHFLGGAAEREAQPFFDDVKAMMKGDK